MRFARDAVIGRRKKRRRKNFRSGDLMIEEGGREESG